MPREEADPNLIERAKHDRSAFAELYRLYLPRVHAFCQSHSQSRDEAEDLTSQTFERALRALPRYQSRGAPLSAWLFHIAANLAIDRGRRSGHVINLGDDPIPEQGIERRDENIPATLIERWERAGQLLDRVAALPPDQQQAIQLRFWEDRSILDVAARLGRSEGATKQLLRRAVRALRQELEQEGGVNA